MRSVPSDELIECPPSMPMSDAILPCFCDALDVVGRQRQRERVRVPRDHAMDDVDLLERRGDRAAGPCPALATARRPTRTARRRRRRVSRGDVGHDRRLRLADVELVEIAFGLLADRPRVVVVPVDDRRVAQQPLRALEHLVRGLRA